MKKFSKKIIGLFLIAFLIVGFFPMTASAEAAPIGKWQITNLSPEEIILGESLTITGVLLDGDSNPVQGKEVWVTISIPAGDDGSLGVDLNLHNGVHGWGIPKTDAAGRFSVSFSDYHPDFNDYLRKGNCDIIIEVDGDGAHEPLKYEKTIQIVPPAFKVTLHPNGGEGDILTEKVKEGSKYELPEPNWIIPQSEKVFQYWGFYNTATSMWENHYIGDIIEINGDTKFEAQWTNPTYYIQINVADDSLGKGYITVDGTQPSSNFAAYSIGDAHKITAVVPEELSEQFEFEYWDKEVYYGEKLLSQEKVYEKEHVIPSNNFKYWGYEVRLTAHFSGDFELIEGLSYNIPAPKVGEKPALKTLVTSIPEGCFAFETPLAWFEMNQYTPGDLSSGDGSQGISLMSSETFEEGKYYTAIIMIDPEDYLEPGQKLLRPEDGGVTIVNGIEIEENLSNYPVFGPLKPIHKIYFDGNGFDDASWEFEVEEGKTFWEAAAEQDIWDKYYASVTVDGVEYVRTDWCIDKEGTAPFDFDQKITDDVIVYAKWQDTSLPRIQCVEGDGSEWIKGSNSPLVFRFVDNDGTLTDPEFLKFVRVKIDGEFIDEDGYEKSEGSVIIALMPEYLETLELGKHIMEPIFVDEMPGKATFTIKEAEVDPGDNPTGGDDPTDGDDPTGGDTPKDGEDKPTDGGDAPADGGDKPTDGGEKPNDGGDTPTDGSTPADGEKTPTDDSEKTDKPQSPSLNDKTKEGGKNTQGASPNTGDESNPFVLVVALMISSLGLLMMKRREND